MSTLPISPSYLWVQYRNHVEKNLQRLRHDPLGTASFISQMGDYFVLQKYPYQLIQQLMSQITELSEQISSTPTNPITTLSLGGESRSLPSSPTSSRNPSTLGTLSSPATPSEGSIGTSSIGGSIAEVPTLRTESTRVLVEFESPSEWYRALEMIRSVEAHRDKMRATGGKSRKPPIVARLL